MKLRSLAFAVPLLGLLELGGHLYFSHRAPTPDEWAAAKPVVERAWHPGEPVVVAPYWAEPIARWKLGDALMPVREVARPDTTRYARAVEVSAMGARSPELAGWRVEREAKAGRLTVRTLVNPSPAHVTFDFTDGARPPFAEATVVRPGREQACTWTEVAPVETQGIFGPPAFPAQRFRCDGESSATFVGVTVIDDEHEHPRRCIWSSPPSAGGELVTKYANVPLGSVVRGHLGIDWIAERDRAGATMTVRVVVDGDEIGKVTHDDGEGWKAFELPLGAHAHAAAATVEFHASAANAPNRHLCFEADSR